MITATGTFGHDIPDPDSETPDPLALLALWLPAPEDELKPLMSLATVDEQGAPDVRHVLLSEFDGQRIHFHTDARSRKVAELQRTPRVALGLVWPEIGRQLTVQGTVEPASSEEAEHAYRSRSRYLQLLAWVNEEDLAQQPQPQRRAEWAAFGVAHPEGTLAAPEHWLGMAVTPQRLTFWRGDPEGPSTRTEYRRSTEDIWTVSRLPG